MTDPRLRQLARAGAPRAQLLVERMRAGELSRERVELAAYLGDEAAREVAGCSAGGNGRAYLPHGRSWPDWNHGAVPLDYLVYGVGGLGLPRWGQEACVRAAVAAVWEAMGWEAEVGEPIVWQGTGEMASLNAIERWAAHPSEKRRRGVGASPATFGRPSPNTIRDAMYALCLAVTGAPLAQGGYEESRAIEVVGICARLTSEQAVREAIRAEVVPWALGERDVVRERVEARR